MRLGIIARALAAAIVERADKVDSLRGTLPPRVPVLFAAVNPATLTRRDVLDVRELALQRRDYARAQVCDLALDGDEAARVLIAYVINDALRSIEEECGGGGKPGLQGLSE